MQKEQQNLNLLIGKKDDELYFVDYIFDHGNNFKGATGSVIRPMSREEYEERKQPENIKDSYAEIWREAVYAKNTEMSLDDWLEELTDDDLFDQSYSQYHDQVRELGYSEEKYPVLEAVGGGRCFDTEMQFDELYNAEAWELIKEAEKK